MTEALEDFWVTMATRAMQTEATRDRLRRADGWADRDGRWHPIGSMSPRYCATVVRFLERRARWLHAGECAQIALLTEPNGSQAACDLEDERSCLYAMDPVAWVGEQPLMRALVARASDTAAGPSPGWLARHPAIAVKVVSRKLMGS